MAQAPRKQSVSANGFIQGSNAGPDTLEPLGPLDHPPGMEGVRRRAGRGLEVLENYNLQAPGITNSELDVLDSVFNLGDPLSAVYNNKADQDYVQDLYNELKELEKNKTLTSDTLRWVRAKTFGRHQNSWIAKRAELAFNLSHPQKEEMSPGQEPSSAAKILYDNSDMN